MKKIYALVFVLTLAGATKQSFAQLSASISSYTNPTCNGQCNGSAVATANGGATPYTYLWTDGQTTSTATGLCAGGYSVTVTDALPATVTATVTIAEPPAMMATSSSTDVSCFGGANGSATVNATGGTTPYTYSWNNSQSTQTATGLVAGTYSVNVEDANGCGQLVNATVNSPSALYAGGDADADICLGDSITTGVFASGGTTAYTYLWSPGGETSSNITVVPTFTTTYTVTVTDANGCNATDNIIVTVNSLPSAYAGADLSICPGSDPVLFSGSGGVSYSWTFNGGSPATSSSQNPGVTYGSPGIYTASLTVTDVSGCSATDNATVTVFSTPSVTLSSANPNCNGGADGTATATATGGTTPYFYLWSTGATTQTATGLPAGNYTVSVTDDNNCTTSANATITEPAVFSASGTMVTSNVSCYGGNNGSGTLIASGGTGSYTYLWSTGSTSQNTTGLAAGNYTGTVTDANGCTAIGSITITQPTAIFVSISKTDVSCNGCANGTAIATVSGGTPPYTYLWSDSSTTDTIFNLVAGTYNLVVTDASGCTANGSVTITQPSACNVTAGFTSNSPQCAGSVTNFTNASTGSVYYSWNFGDGASPSSVPNPSHTYSSAGIYTVTLIADDGAGCTDTALSNVTINSVPVVSATSINVSCNGGSNGIATASGATTYLWSNGATTSTITGLAIGVYNVTGTNSSGCSATGNATVSQPAAISVSISSTNESCNGCSDGTAIASVNGGTPSYTYQWSNSATTDTIFNLVAGTYNLVVTDVNGCTANGSVTITQPTTGLSASVSTNNTSCGNCDGSASVSATGGTTPYMYQWSSGATTSSVNGLCAGTYVITVTDSDNTPAQVVDTIIIGSGGCAPLAGFTFSNSCNTTNFTDNSTGSPSSWQWNFGDGNSSTQQNPSYVYSSSGTYSVMLIATNSNGSDTIVTNVSVTIYAALSVTLSTTNTGCNGCSDGSATAIVSGGTSPYSYQWSNGDTTASVSGLPASVYFLTVTDANGCTATDTATITEPSGTPPTASFTYGNTALCSGNTLSFTDQSTESPTNWYWTFSGGTPSTSTQQNPSVTYTSSGTYSVMLIVSNAFGSDTITGNVNVTVSAEPSLITSSTNATCNGCANGSASVSANGGTSPYTYLWSNADTSASLSGIVAGTYSVTVTDASGCTASSSVTITEPAALAVTVAGNNPTCSNGNNGNALASVSGGVSPYTYQWSNGKITSLIVNLQAGTYTVTVTDFTGATATGSITLTAPAAINLSLSALDASCGTANGLASVSASGGSTPYTYLWSNGQTSSIASNLTAGMYSVTVTAANGCKAVGSTTVNTSSGFAVSFSGTNISCNGAGNGVASATATGGSTPYSYQWSNGGTSASITGLGAGTYFATVTDNSGCAIPGTVNISQPSSMVLALNGTNVSSCGSSNGAINLTATGGTAPYTFLWSNSATTEDLSGLGTGTYSVTVTDANGCSKTKSLAITAPSAATLTLNSNNVSCNGACDGIAIAMASGGNSPYTYNWSNGKTGSAVTGMCTGTYTVTAVESGGCSVSGSVTVTQPTALSVTASATAATCGVSNGTLSSSATGGTTPYSYQWSSGDTTVTADSLTSGIYLVTVTDSNGCSNFGMATISNGGAPTLTVNSVTNVLCNGASNGAIDITASGAATPFTYAWSNGATTQDISVLSAGPYEVTVTNTNNCVSVQSINVSQPDALVLSVSVNDASCGNADGDAGVTVSGGTTPYSYSWSNSATSSQISNLSAQIYAVTVTDNKGCIKTAAAPVGEVGGPVVTLDSVVSAGCNGTGSVFVSVADGVPPYTFAWDNGSVNEDLLGVTAGSYGLIVSDINGCSGAISAGIAAQQISTDPICLMTVDTVLGTNKIVWQKTFGSGISSYKIYRETTQAGVFQQVGTVPFDSLSVFTDPVANPLIHSWRYKISAVDSCGNESAKSSEHKTMHVTINLGLGGTINLIWDHYQGFAYPTYYIYRFKPQTGWTLLDSLASNTTSYTDYFPPTFYGLQYFVEARHPDGCFATKSVENHNSSRSNRSSAAMPAPNDLLADSLVTDATQGNCDGEATVIPSGGISPYTYLWDDNNTQTTAMATGLCQGSYNCTVTDTEGDTTIVTVVIGVQIGIGENSVGSFRIYPNPNKGLFTVQGLEWSNSKIVVYNMLGEMICQTASNDYQNSVIQIDISKYGRGVYHLQLFTVNGNSAPVKIVVN